MRTITRYQVIVLIGLILSIPRPGTAAKTTGVSAKTPTSVTSLRSDKTKQNHDKKTERKGLKKQHMPIYRPPLRGAPSGRIAGGTRGLGQQFPYLCSLVPEHVGRTTSKQPRLYYFLSAATTFPLEFTIIEKQAVYPLVETRIELPRTAGIHVINLADYDKKLNAGTQYRWFIALVPDNEHRCKDILAAGTIEWVAASTALKTKLEDRSDTEKAAIYAETGIWYDSLSSISNAIDKHPEARNLHQQRASLLEQIGLPEVALYEYKQVKN